MISETAFYPAITTGTYLISSENVIGWRENFDHVLVDALDEENLSENPEEGLRGKNGNLIWVVPRAKNVHRTPGDVLISLEEVEEKVSMPCPKCFPESDEAERFVVTDMPGGGTRSEPKDPGREGDR